MPRIHLLAALPIPAAPRPRVDLYRLFCVERLAPPPFEPVDGDLRKDLSEEERAEALAIGRVGCKSAGAVRVKRWEQT